MEQIGLLLVEDDALILEDLATILDWEREGFRVIAATNGKQGLHQFEQFQPLVVMTDVRMPFMDGLEMMREIRRRNPYVQFLVLSAYDDFASAQEALRQGARDYILKQDISARALREKLSAIRADLDGQLEFARSAVQNRLYELVSGRTEDPAQLQEKLSGILRLGGYFPEADLLEPARRFAMDLMAGEQGWTGADGPEEVTGRAFFDALRAWLLARGQTRGFLRDSGMDGVGSAVVLRAKELIQERYADPDLSAKEIARAVGISYGRLSVLFREETGETINDALTETRIREAKRLLCTGDHKIYEVAERTGYRSSQYFSYVFRAQVGQSPLQYRRGE